MSSTVMWIVFETRLLITQLLNAVAVYSPFASKILGTVMTHVALFLVMLVLALADNAVLPWEPKPNHRHTDDIALT